MLLLLVALGLAACGLDSPTTGRSSSPGVCGDLTITRNCRVRYEVLGVGAADVTFFANDSTGEAKDVSLPWTYEFDNELVGVSVHATAPESGQPLTCHVYVNGRRIASDRGEGRCVANYVVISTS